MAVGLDLVQVPAPAPLPAKVEQRIVPAEPGWVNVLTTFPDGHTETVHKPEEKA